MRHTKKLCIVLGLVCVVFLLISCSRQSEELGGVPVTPEMLESVSRSLSENDKAEQATVNSSMSNQANSSADAGSTAATITADTILSDVVYWTESGTVYHVKDTCGALRHSNNILHGSIEEAILAKKERACKTCS